jgi:hypothetical protein
LVWADGKDAANFLGCVLLADEVHDECALCVDALAVKLVSQPRKNRDHTNNLRIDGILMVEWIA